MPLPIRRDFPRAMSRQPPPRAAGDPRIARFYERFWAAHDETIRHWEEAKASGRRPTFAEIEGRLHALGYLAALHSELYPGMLRAMARRVEQGWYSFLGLGARRGRA